MLSIPATVKTGLPQLTLPQEPPGLDNLSKRVVSSIRHTHSTSRWSHEFSPTKQQSTRARLAPPQETQTEAP